MIQRIIDECELKRGEVLERVIHEFTYRLARCQEVNGEHKIYTISYLK